MRGIVIAMAALAATTSIAAARTVTGADAAEFKVGVTTLADVEGKLGKPQSVSTLSDGTSVIVYMAMKSHAKAAIFIPVVGLFAGGATAHSSMVSFTFGPDGKLTSTSSNETNANCSALGKCD
jgi:hypothetical protein